MSIRGIRREYSFQVRIIETNENETPELTITHRSIDTHVTTLDEGWENQNGSAPTSKTGSP